MDRCEFDSHRSRMGFPISPFRMKSHDGCDYIIAPGIRAVKIRNIFRKGGQNDAAYINGRKAFRR